VLLESLQNWTDQRVWHRHRDVKMVEVRELVKAFHSGCFLLKPLAVLYHRQVIELTAEEHDGRALDITNWDLRDVGRTAIGFFIQLLVFFLEIEFLKSLTIDYLSEVDQLASRSGVQGDTVCQWHVSWVLKVS